MYNGNSRFNELPNGVITEQISYQTQIFYNPTTQQARCIFNCLPFMTLPNPAGGVSYMQVGADNDILEVDFMDKLTDMVCKPGDVDPISGAPLDQISIYGVQVIIKRALDKYHNDREIARLQAIADAEAAAAAAEAAAQAAAEAAAAAAAQGGDGTELPPPEQPPEE